MGRALATVVIFYGTATAFLLGCGGGPVPIEELGSQYAAVFCRKVYTCCDAAELTAGGSTGMGEASCRKLAAGGLSNNIESNKESVDAGRIIYHADSARRCLDAVTALPCAQWGVVQLEDDLSQSRFSDCVGIFEGTVLPNAPCSRSTECIDGTCGLTDRVCVALPKEGESCPGDRCVTGLGCLTDAAGNFTVCGALRADGSPCVLGGECESNFCNQGATGARTCGPPTMCNGV
jgi:hypothetical protein